MSWGNERWSRRMHRIIGVSSVGFLLFMVITGLLWANAQYTYWDAGYKERVGSVLPAPSVESARISLHELFDHLHHHDMLAGREIQEVSLRQDFGRLFYDVRLSGGHPSSSILIDALSKERLSPISRNLAAIIAQQYVSTESHLAAITMESYTPQNTNLELEAIRVNFDRPDAATIILDRHTGRILEDESLWRQFHFLVKQLHQLNFFGFNKTLLNIPGMVLLIMGISGLWLWRLQVIREHRAQQKALHSEYGYTRPTRQS
ncbi:PepSY domain-containing protein [Nitrospira sp. M1]